MTAPELRRHIREFLEDNGEDRRFAELVDGLRLAERALGEAGDERETGEPTPGRRSAAKASGDETSGGEQRFPPDEQDEASLPPFLKRKRREGKDRQKVAY